MVKGKVEFPTLIWVSDKFIKYFLFCCLWDKCWWQSETGSILLALLWFFLWFGVDFEVNIREICNEFVFTLYKRKYTDRYFLETVQKWQEYFSYEFLISFWDDVRNGIFKKFSNDGLVFRSQWGSGNKINKRFPEFLIFGIGEYGLSVFAHKELKEFKVVLVLINELFNGCVQR